MGVEKSAGAVVFHRVDDSRSGKQIEYLLLLADYWGFPKGHIERGESERDAALREIREEAGLDVKLIEGFRVVDEYWYQRKGERIKKQAIFFLGQAEDRNSKISWEHQELAWLSFEQATERLKFKNLKATLEKAHAFLQNVKIET